MKSSFNKQTDPRPTGSVRKPNDTRTGISNHENSCPLFENATFFMLEREESLLGEIVQEFSVLMANAQQQANEVADDIEQRL